MSIFDTGVGWDVVWFHFVLTTFKTSNTNVQTVPLTSEHTTDCDVPVCIKFKFKFIANDFCTYFLVSFHVCYGLCVSVFILIVLSSFVMFSKDLQVHIICIGHKLLRVWPCTLMRPVRDRRLLVTCQSILSWSFTFISYLVQELCIIHVISYDEHGSWFWRNEHWSVH